MGPTHSLSLRIDWADLDLFGHVNNVAFFRYIQSARVSFCDAMGLSSIDPGANPGFMVASSECQFRKPLTYPGSVRLTVTVAWVRQTSFQLTYRLHDDMNALAAEAADVLVVYDHVSHCKKEIPVELREKLNALQAAVDK